MKSLTRIVSVATLAALLATQALAAAGSSVPRSGARCHGVPVTITENKKGDPLSNRDDVVIGTRKRDVVNLLGGNDKIYGDRGDDLICGGSGRDLLLGGPGDDVEYGDQGKDFSRGIAAGGLANPPRVVGGPGDDELHGGLGRDAINGSSGDDDMFGDGGNDLFNGGSGFDKCDGGPGKDKQNGSCDKLKSIP